MDLNSQITETNAVYDDKIFVGIACFNKKGVIVSLRKNCKTMSDLYGFPGGKVDDSDASIEDAIIRELQEETGYKANKRDLNKIGVDTRFGKGYNLFALKVPERIKFIIPESESENFVDWFFIKEVQFLRLALNKKLTASLNLFHNEIWEYINNYKPKKVQPKITQFINKKIEKEDNIEQIIINQELDDRGVNGKTQNNEIDNQGVNGGEIQNNEIKFDDQGVNKESDDQSSEIRDSNSEIESDNQDNEIKFINPNQEVFKRKYCGDGETQDREKSCKLDEIQDNY